MPYTLNVFTSTWFRDPDGDTLNYQCTMSDGTDRPSWIGYDTSTGELRGFPNMTGSSQYLNLMFTAFDTKEGFYSYHKTLLVDSKPMTKSLFKILELAVDRQFAYYYSDLFYDPDGDFLYFYI